MRRAAQHLSGDRTDGGLSGMVPNQSAGTKSRRARLTTGSVIETTVVSDARTPVELQLELIQGVHRETIGARMARVAPTNDGAESVHHGAGNPEKGRKKR